MKNNNNIWSELEIEETISDNSLQKDINISEKENRKIEKKEVKEKNKEEKNQNKINDEKDIIYKKTPKFKVKDKVKKSTIWIIVAIIVAGTVIVIPFAIMFGVTKNLIRNPFDLKSTSGFTVDETTYSVKHVESGKYIQNPSTEYETIRLGDTKISTFQFTTGATGSDLKIESESMVSSSYLTMQLDENKNPSWSSEDEGEDVISLEKKKGENLYGIKFEVNNMYLVKEDSSDDLSFSHNPDWFEFEAVDVQNITTTDEYIANYEDLNPGEEVSIGISGTPLSIQSTSNSKMWLNTTSGKLMMDEKDENFFIPETTNGILTNGLLSIGSYQTLDTIPRSQADLYYPLINVEGPDIENNFQIQLTQFENGHLLPDDKENGDDVKTKTPDNAIIELSPNPVNLREKAIYFPSSKTYLSSDDEQIISSPEPEYFNFVHTSLFNPELFEIENISNSTFASIFTITAENFKMVDEYQITAWGINTSSKEIEDEIEMSIRPNNELEKIKFQDLNPELSYIGKVDIYREDGVGNHVTTKLLEPFGKEFLYPKAENISIWNSTIENASEDGSSGISILDADTSAQVTIDFKQGVGIQEIDELGLKVESMDETHEGTVIATNTNGDSTFVNNNDGGEDDDKLESGEYTFTISDLEPETQYTVTTQYGDKDGNMDDQLEIREIKEDVGVNQIYISTERTMVILDEDKNSEIVVNDDGNFTVFDGITYLENSTLDDVMTFTNEDGKNINGEEVGGSTDPNVREYSLWASGGHIESGSKVTISMELEGWEGWEKYEYWDYDNEIKKDITEITIEEQ